MRGIEKLFKALIIKHDLDINKIYFKIIIPLLFFSCNSISCFKLKGVHGVSLSIQESKSRRVFIGKFKIVNSESKEIQDAFLEKIWWFGNTENETSLPSKAVKELKGHFNFTLIMIMKNKINLYVNYLQVAQKATTE